MNKNSMLFNFNVIYKLEIALVGFFPFLFFLMFNSSFLLFFFF